MKTLPLDPRLDAALPVFISAGALALLFGSLGHFAWVMPSVLGVMAGGLVDLDNGMAGRLKNTALTALLFSCTTLIVQATIGHAALFAAAMTALTFALTFAGAAGLRYRTIAFGALAVACYAALTHTPHAAWFSNTMLIVLGTLLYSAIRLLMQAIFPHRHVQLAMANAFDALAIYFEEKADFFDPDEVESLRERAIALAMKNAGVIAAFGECRRALFYRLRGQHRHPRTLRMLRCYFAAQDMHERISSTHADYRQLAGQLENTDLIFRIRRLLELQGQACRDMAASLRGGDPYIYSPRMARAVEGCRRSLHVYMQQHPGEWAGTVQQLLGNIFAIDGQLVHLQGSSALAGRRAAAPRQHIRAAVHEDWRGIWGAVRAQSHLHSRVMHHAVRLSLVVCAACCIVQLFHLDRGYWILLSALFVCQPNYSATKSLVAQRVAGTSLGVLVGSLVPWFAPSPQTKLWIIVIATALYFASRSSKRPWAVFFITIQALTALSLAGADVYGAMPVRFIDTALGAGLAWAAVYWLWPDWKYVDLASAAAHSAAACGAYLRHIAAQLQHGGSADDVEYRAARRAAHERAAELGSILSNMSSEPARYGARMQQGFNVLQIMHALIGYISALGAYRSRMDREEEQEFSRRFFTLSQQAADALERLGQPLQENDFETSLAQLHSSLAALHEDIEGEHQRTMLWQQLDMIARQLAPCRALLLSIANTSAAAASLPRPDTPS